MPTFMSLFVTITTEAHTRRSTGDGASVELVCVCVLSSCSRFLSEEEDSLIKTTKTDERKRSKANAIN